MFSPHAHTRAGAEDDVGRTNLLKYVRVGHLDAVMAAIPDQPLRSPFFGGEGLVCPETGNPWPGAWVRVGIQPWLAPWDTLGAFGHQAATALITPAVRPHRG